MSHVFREEIHYVRYRGADVFSSLGVVGPEPPSDRAGIMQELVHEFYQFGGLVVSSRAEHVDVVETSEEKVVSVDGKSVSHDKGSVKKSFDSL